MRINNILPIYSLYFPYHCGIMTTSPVSTNSVILEPSFIESEELAIKPRDGHTLRYKPVRRIRLPVVTYNPVMTQLDKRTTSEPATAFDERNFDAYADL